MQQRRVFYCRINAYRACKSECVIEKLGVRGSRADVSRDIRLCGEVARSIEAKATVKRRTVAVELEIPSFGRQFALFGVVMIAHFFDLRHFCC